MARKLSFTGLIIAAIAVLLISVSFSMPVISYGEDELQNAAETTAETTMQFSEEKTAEVSEEPAKENTAPAETASAPEKSAPSEDLAAAQMKLLLPRTAAFRKHRLRTKQTQKIRLYLQNQKCPPPKVSWSIQEEVLNGATPIRTRVLSGCWTTAP